MRHISFVAALVVSVVSAIGIPLVVRANHGLAIPTVAAHGSKISALSFVLIVSSLALLLVAIVIAAVIVHRERDGGSRDGGSNDGGSNDGGSNEVGPS